MTAEIKRPGLIRKAPENFLDPQLLREIHEQGLDEKRRRFLRQSFLMASAASAVSAATSTSMSFATEVGTEGVENSAAGDPNILVLPPHSTTLGKPVAQAGYGQPSRHENTILKRASPGLTRTQEASASFTPLQALFGIITPNGLHFERHHQGWHDISPDTHRLMIHGLVKTPMICTLDDPAVPALAAELATTRTAAAMELWRPYLAGSVVAIGNAPTALFRLLEMLDAGAPKPALIIGIPVGFVGAVESKDALMADGRVPAIIVHGRRGGSAMTVAAVNALASERE